MNVAEILVNHGATLDPETKVKPLLPRRALKTFL